MTNVDIFLETTEVTKNAFYWKDGRIILLKYEPKQLREAIYISEETAHGYCAEPGESLPFVIGRCAYEVKNMDSFSAARAIAEGFWYDGKGKILVLNFANSIHPGGGVRFGARAQEEDLCRKSTLYASLTSEQAKPYYKKHEEQRNDLASDAMILSPHVAIFRDEENRFLDEPLYVGVLTCAAPVASARGELSEEAYKNLMYQRITSMLHVAAHYHYKYLVLGAWGCDAFGNDAAVVSDLFFKALKEFRYGKSYKEKDLFKHVIFAVLDRSAQQYNFHQFDRNFARFYRAEDEEQLRRETARIQENRKAREVYLDKIRGSLIGGAAGDALGYPVEFKSWREIQIRYGEQGIQAYELDVEAGAAVVSDDTQMTLFTANGILIGDTRGCMRGLRGPTAGYVEAAYRDWYRAQNDPNMAQKDHISWLYDRTEMHARRAPGTTCLTSLGTGRTGAVGSPCNNSKGCGGVMRVAPLALHYQPRDDAYRLELDKDGAEIAAITHGHPLGYIPAAMLTHIISVGVYGGCGRGDTLTDAVEEAMAATREIFSPDHGMHLDTMESLTRKAMDLAASDGDDEANIRAIGQGWVAEEALAIAIYCCLRYPNDFSKAIIAAVNHSGDSDSTGSITGNILGAWLGYHAIEEKWLKALEMKDVILEVADDLCYGCQMSEYGIYRDLIWTCKYIYGRYARTREHARALIEEME